MGKNLRSVQRYGAGLCIFGVFALIGGYSFASGAFKRQTGLVVKPYKPSGIYNVGEKVGWTIELADSSSPSGKYSYSLRKNNQEVVQAGQIEPSSGKATIEIIGDQPEMLYLQLSPVEGARGRGYGAVVAPTKLKPVVERPKDFDRFWKEKIAMLKAIPMNPVLTPADSGRPDVEYATIQMDHINGAHVYGQIAKPSKPGKYPAMLILQWASPPYPLQRPWVVDRAAEGWLALNIEPHDVLPTAPQSYYNALPAAIKNYTSIGQDDRDKGYFLQMYLADYRALDYLASRPDWNGKVMLVTGTSMGGQQSLCVAGLHPKVTHVIVEEPSGCDMNAALHGRQEGYPNFPSNNPKVMEAARYFDCINFAPHIRATSLVAMGFVDTVAPPAGIWTAFNLIKGGKEVAPMPEAPHNNTATREQQQPYFTRSYEWMSALAKGKRVPIKKLP